jgi:hypothetical protein
MSALGLLQNLDKGNVPSLREAMPEVDPRLDAAVARTLCPEPPTRFPSMLDFMRALVPCAGPDLRAIWAERLVSRATASSTKRQP